MMNIFTNNDMINDVFNSISYPAIFNDTDESTKRIQNVAVTTANLGEFSRRHLHSLDKFNQGDLVKVDGNYYLVMEDVITSRHNKYKATIEHCNNIIQTPDKQGERVLVGYDSLGRPQYKYQTIPGKQVQSIAKYEDVRLSGTGQIILPVGTLSVYVQDNPFNKEEFTIGYDMEIKDDSFRIIDVNLTRIGLIKLTVEKFIG